MTSNQIGEGDIRYLITKLKSSDWTSTQLIIHALVTIGLVKVQRALKGLGDKEEAVEILYSITKSMRKRKEELQGRLSDGKPKPPQNSKHKTRHTIRRAIR